MMSYWLPMWLPFFLNPTNQFKGVALAPDAVAKIDELLTRFLIENPTLFVRRWEQSL